jgi:L-amino acid N-acyltransferase YncA
MPVNVRLADLADLVDAEQIHSIYKHYVENSVMTFEKAPGPSVEEIRSRMARVVESDLLFVVAEEHGAEGTNGASGQVVGYAYVAEYRPRPAYYSTAELSIFVRDGLQNRGVGTVLMEQVLSILRTPGRKREIHQLLAVMAVDEEDGDRKAERFYERHGFALAGRLNRVGFKFDKWIDSQ